MESAPLLNPTVVLAIIAVVVISVRTAVDIRTLWTVPARKEHITREEYEKDEKARKERHRAVLVKCRLNAKRQVAERNRVDKKFEMLIDSIGELKVQLARVATWLEQAELHQRVQVVSARPMTAPPNGTTEPLKGTV
jgi:primosomal protein N''